MYDVVSPSRFVGKPMTVPGLRTGIQQVRTILIVEDNLRLRSITADGLRAYGFDTLVAGDAAEALDCLDQCPEIDLLLTDVRMPGTMDGLALAFAVQHRSPHMPIILISGHLDPETTPLPEGAAFLRKPCCIGTLIIAIGQQSKLGVLARP